MTLRHIASTNRYACAPPRPFTPCLWRSRSRWMTRTPPNPSASTAAVLLQLHDRDFLSSSFAKERLSNSFAFDSFVRNQASVRESKKKKKKKKKRSLISRGGFVRNLRTMLCTPLPCFSDSLGCLFHCYTHAQRTEFQIGVTASLKNA